MTASVAPSPVAAPVAAPNFDQLVEARRAQLAARPTEIVDAVGHPVPPHEVVRRLPPGASIKWVPSAGFYGTAYFALFKRWSPGDPRWQRVQSGEIKDEDARDIVQMFPRECPTHEMAAYVENRWGARNAPADPRAEADRMVAEAQKLYAQAEAESIDRAIDVSNQRSERESRHDLRVRAGADVPTPMVTVAADVSPAVPDGPKRLI